MEKAYALWRAFQEKILAPVAAVIMLGCTLLALLEVGRRYLLGASFHWQQDAVTYFTLSAVFLFFGIAQRRGSHLTVDILTHAIRAVGPRTRRVAEYIEVLATIASFAFMIMVVWWGWDEVVESQQYAPRTESLELPLTPFLWVLLVSFVFMVISLFFQSWRGIQKLRGRDVLEEHITSHDLVD